MNSAMYTNGACSLTTKIQVRLNGVLSVEAHARSCVYIMVRTRIFILKIFSFSRIVYSRQCVSTSEDNVRVLVFYAIKFMLHSQKFPS